MHTLELHSDRFTAANLEKRRNIEIQRQNRIFNAKIRTIGIDKDALDYQERERKRREEEEAYSLKAYAADLVCNDRAACLLERRQRMDQRQIHHAIQQFRDNFQQPASRREFDLNDPTLLRKQEGGLVLPGLVGEDPDSKERHRRQQKQLREWFLQQHHELETARRQQTLADQQYDQGRISLDNRAVDLQKIEDEGKRAVAVATKDFNLAKAAETADRRQRERLQEEEDNRVDMLNQLQGELLSESQEQESGVLGLPRLHPCGYKGLSPQELKNITDCQLQQVEEKKRARLEQQQQELQQDRLRLASARTALLLERQQARLNRQLRRTLDNDNAQLAKAHHAQKNYLEKQVYTNVPDVRFFSQFNTSSR